MLDIGWTELLVIAIVLIVVVGPKDLPPMLRAFGKMTTNLRKMAGDFRSQFDEALRESDLDDVRRTISDAQRLNPTNALREAINPLRQMGQDIRADLQRSTQVPSAPDLSKTDIEAQQAVEGLPGADATAEAPAVSPSPAANASSAGPAVSTTAPAQSQPASVEPIPAQAVAQKPKPVRKTAARQKPASQEIAAAKPTLEKPNRNRAAPLSASPAQVANEVGAAPAVRKRAPKKTDMPKDEA